MLYLEDEAGGDEKILAVPITSVSPYYKDVDEYTDLPPIVVEQIEHFFTHYKDLEPEKWVRVGKWGDAAAARQVVLDSIAKAKREGSSWPGSPAAPRWKKRRGMNSLRKVMPTVRPIGSSRSGW